MPQTQDRVTSSNYSPVTDSNWEEDSYERREDEKVQAVAHPKMLRVESNSAPVILVPRGR